MKEEANALAQASSAYLRSAQHQPVQWQPWGEEAFARAQRENRPILLDIGAVWCHWCHVMDRESYENPEIAALIHQSFIPVKVDRDERPDVDSRYQAAVQAISGQGGWPLTAFLTPDGRPFFGGTYFPPEDRGGRPGLKRVLAALAQAWREKPNDVLESAASVMAVIDSEAFAGQHAAINPAIIGQVVATAQSMFDAENGGFGSSPKFPHPAVLDLLIDHYATTGDAHTREIFVTTLDHMARGGVYDQIGGGFHRYSTDEHWTVPHFEKMAYDNSELLKNYVHAWQVTGISEFASTAADIIRWMDSWLSDRRRGGFYASQDADISLDDDGDYFTWTLAEAEAVLTPEELEVARLHYGINQTGQMHHNHFKNVLRRGPSVEELAPRLNRSPYDLADLLASARHKLYEARCRRPTPYIDRTLYTSWNALCISAYLEAARVLSATAVDAHQVRNFALRSLDRLLAEAWHPGAGLKHVIAYGGVEAEGEPATPAIRGPGGLDDYAFAILACLDAYEVSGDATYFNFAQSIGGALLERFEDREHGGFFDIEASANPAQGALAARRKPFQDSPTPAGNSAAAVGLLRLHAYTTDERYRRAARRTLEVIAGVASQFGLFAATYAIATVWLTQPHTQVVVVGNDEAADRLYAAAAAPFALNKAALRLRDSEAVAEVLPPALRETIPHLPGVREGVTTAVICTNFTCQPPLDDPEALKRTLATIISGMGKEQEPEGLSRRGS